MHCQCLGSVPADRHSRQEDATRWWVGIRPWHMSYISWWLHHTLHEMIASNNQCSVYQFIMMADVALSTLRAIFTSKHNWSTRYSESQGWHRKISFDINFAFPYFITKFNADLYWSADPIFLLPRTAARPDIRRTTFFCCIYLLIKASHIFRTLKLISGTASAVALAVFDS